MKQKSDMQMEMKCDALRWNLAERVLMIANHVDDSAGLAGLATLGSS
jgi:hypothetical protein